MRRVIQKTVTTTRIISLTITHSESEEAVEYTLVDGVDQLNEPIATAPDQAVEDHIASDCVADDELPKPAVDIVAADNPELPHAKRQRRKDL